MKASKLLWAAAAAFLTIPLAGPAMASEIIEGTPLPVCAEEDGFGAELCLWDGVISGDCAPEYVGGFEVSNKCVYLHRTNPEAVKECVEEWNLYDPADPKYDGFTFEECLKAIH